MKIKRLAVVVITVLLTLILPLQVQAAATSQGLLGVSWNHDQVSVYIFLQKGVDPSYKDQVITAFNDWSTGLRAKSGSSTAFGFTFLTEQPGKKNPADITVAVRKNTGNVLGSTSLSSGSGTIQSVKITLAAYNAMGMPLGVSDFRSIARHEIGHALGLGHANDNRLEPLDLMAPIFDVSGVNYDIYPSALNLDAAFYIYGSDGFGGINTSPLPASYP